MSNSETDSDYSATDEAIRLVTQTVQAGRAVQRHVSTHYNKETIHDASQTGAEWLREIRNRSPHVMKAELGVTPTVFSFLLKELVDHAGLKDSRHIEASERLAIFLYTCRRNSGVRPTASRFNWSYETVASCFTTVVKLMSKDPFYSRWVYMPLAIDLPSQIITRDKRMRGYFDKCAGAIDGTLIPAHVPIEDQEKWRSRKGEIQINVLAACMFDLRFCYLLSGWEGSTNDGTLFNEAIKVDLVLPPGTCLLADAGFGGNPELLVPYRAVRYHLGEWHKATDRNMLLKDHKELFNLRHLSARNAVERIFGVIKRKWPIMREGSEYPMKTQIRLVYALGVLYNACRSFERDSELYISTRGPTNTQINQNEVQSQSSKDRIDDLIEEQLRIEVLGQNLPVDRVVESSGGERNRNTIAVKMWNDYLKDIEQSQ